MTNEEQKDHGKRKNLHIAMYNRPEYGDRLLLCTLSLKIETELLNPDVSLRCDPANVAQSSTVHAGNNCQLDA